MSVKNAEELCEELADVIDEIDGHLLDAKSLPPKMIKALVLDLDRAFKSLQRYPDQMAETIRDHHRQVILKTTEQKRELDPPRKSPRKYRKS